MNHSQQPPSKSRRTIKRFIIKRFQNPLGLEVYSVENTSLRQRIFIPRFMFDLVRKNLVRIYSGSQLSHSLKIDFKNRTYYLISPDGEDPQTLHLIEDNASAQSTGRLSVSLKQLPQLLNAMFATKLGHPGDSLDLICGYHRLFQFSFIEGGDSINSGLLLRREILCQVDQYQPKLYGDAPLAAALSKGNGAGPVAGNTPLQPADAKQLKAAGYKSRLGERKEASPLRVNYEALFSGSSTYGKTPKAADSGGSQVASGATRTMYPLPLSATEIKQYNKNNFSCHLSSDEMQEFRQIFLRDREAEFFLGLEILDAIFRRPSGLRCFRFPLYYLRVRLEESGRELFITPESPDIYLNHLALANLVENFADSPGSDQKALEQFFHSLLSQSLKVSNHHDRLRLTRKLPVDEVVFERYREVLLGFHGENGRGGLLGHLNLVGIEGDTEAVALYKAPKSSVATAAALDHDLHTIQEIAHSLPRRFYGSLLGQFLTPEARNLVKKRPYPAFATTPFIPQRLPQSTKRLLSKLNDHDLVVLEGPPGTGKTYSIRNLFIHSVLSGKKLLIVSDQAAAIHALTEKLQEYLVGRDHGTPSGKAHLELLNTAIKIVDKIPEGSSSSLERWSQMLKEMLHLGDPRYLNQLHPTPMSHEAIEEIDRQIAAATARIQDQLEARLHPTGDHRKRVAHKRRHPTTQEHIKSTLTFMGWLTAPDEHHHRLSALSQYLDGCREVLESPELVNIYQSLAIPSRSQSLLKGNESLVSILLELAELKGLFQEEVSELISEPSHEHPCWQLILNQLPVKGELKGWQILWHKLRSQFKDPARDLVKKFVTLYQGMIAMQQLLIKAPPKVLHEILQLHRFLGDQHQQPDIEVPLIFEITEAAIAQYRHARDALPDISLVLKEISDLYHKRDHLIKEGFKQRLLDISRTAYAYKDNAGEATAASTAIQSLLDNLGSFESFEGAQSLVLSLREKLLETFPIWICRKQAVSFLFPCQEQIFDLVIVDEATQCRVHDALPLLFRAQKLMVVGDDKQTALDRNSVVDDYLFQEFDLSEHLKAAGVASLKGGGSHIFAAVKAIKQAAVMLDEHYRCPPDIISYSNRYVYNSELKTMQWHSGQSSSSVVVDYSEEITADTGRQTSGKYKGLETAMMDRFIDYVVATIEEIEAETGRRIQTNTDVAICYFLLKNEAYFKDVKGKLLQRLDRGDDILDGAGAALQGKERDYIFYYWDINSGNINAFRQGDDPSKRKGELNVLMSRPKVRAYHYLHKGFRNLPHSSASITDYLWKTYSNAYQDPAEKAFTKRTQQPDGSIVAWNRSSGPLMEAMLGVILEPHGGLNRYRCQPSVVVGDPHQRVDLVLIPRYKKYSGPIIGLIDAVDFGGEPGAAERLIDYYFQCLRAGPTIEPVCLFMHELALSDSAALRSLLALMNLEKKSLAG